MDWRGSSRTYVVTAAALDERWNTRSQAANIITNQIQ
jgi:hypothetical protein